MLVCTGPDVQPNDCHLHLKITLLQETIRADLDGVQCGFYYVHIETLDLKQEATEWLRRFIWKNVMFLILVQEPNHIVRSNAQIHCCRSDPMNRAPKPPASLVLPSEFPKAKVKTNKALASTWLSQVLAGRPFLYKAEQNCGFDENYPEQDTVESRPVALTKSVRRTSQAWSLSGLQMDGSQIF